MNPDRAVAFLKARVESGSVTWYDLVHFVAYYQAAHGLVVDGMPGEQTIARLAGFVEEISGVHDMPPVLDAAARRARAVARMVAGYAWQQEQRAKGVKVGYGLGFGGKDPTAPHPYEYDEHTGVWRCDCSGGVCWAWELPRKDPETGIWNNTDKLEADARGQVKHDLGLEVPWEEALAGDIVVYGAGPRVGHTGLFTKDGAVEVMHVHGGPHGGMDYDTKPAWWRVTKHAVVLRMR